MEEDKLARYIVDDLFKWFKDERSTLLEPQMRRNYDAFKGKYNSDSLKKWRATEGFDWRSKVFVRLTKQKVLAGFNNCMAALLQKGELPWDIAPTPISQTGDMTVIPPEEAALRCDRMKKNIHDDFSECHADRVFQGSTLETVLYGWSWLHGPVLRKRNRVAVNFGIPGMDMFIPPRILQQYGRHSLAVVSDMKPAAENLPCWNVFWDLENPDHQAGHGIVYREMMSKGRFLDLADEPGYDAEAVKALAAQFSENNENSEDDDDSQGPIREQYSRRRRVIPVYFFYGRVPRKYLSDSKIESGSGSREAEVFCVCAKAKTAVVIRKPVVNLMPYRPIYMAKWQGVPSESAGIGLPEDMEDSQMIINGLTRALLDNKALAANLLISWNPRKMAPGQNKTLYPGKVFEVDDSVENVQSAMQFFSPPDNTRSIPEQVEMFRQFADEETGIARTMEGQQGPKNRTAYEMAKMAEAGNKMIAGNIRNLDEGHIEPLVTAFYHWNMMTSPDESIKGDYTVSATGYQSYLEKEKRSQDIMALLQFSISNQFTAQFTKILPFLRELARSRDLDPDRFYPSDEELNQQTEELSRMLPKTPGAVPPPAPGMEQPI